MAKFYPVTADFLRSVGWRSPDIIAKTVEAWNDVGRRYAFTTARRCAIFWGEISYECNGGTELRENLSYSTPARIVAVFGRPHASVTLDEAKGLVHAPASLGDRVYGSGNPWMANQLGNTQPGDGYHFRGAGALNTTGREAFARVGKAIGQDLVGNPDLANDPGIALLMGAEEYRQLGCIELSDTIDIVRVTKRVNGGTNGLADRETLIAKCQAYFDSVTPIEYGAPDVAAPHETGAIAVPAPLADAQSTLQAVQSTPSAAVPMAVPGTKAAMAGGAAVLASRWLSKIPSIHLTEIHMSPLHILLGLGLTIVLLILIADRIIRYKVTPGKNWLSAFENDVFTATSHIGLMASAFLAAVQAWLTAYMPLFSDNDFMTVVHSLWPSQEISAVIAGLSLFLKTLTIGRTLPLPTFNAVAPPANQAAPNVLPGTAVNQTFPMQLVNAPASKSE